MNNTSQPTEKQKSDKNKPRDKYIRQFAQQVELAFQSRKTPKKVKACLYSIIVEASTEASLGLTDFSLVGQALPNIINNLPEEYGRGFMASIGAILRFDTDAVKEFYDKGFQLKDSTSPLYAEIASADTETLAVALSAIMHNENMPEKLYNVIADHLNFLTDIHTPQIILHNLEKLNETEAR